MPRILSNKSPGWRFILEFCGLIAGQIGSFL